MPDQKITEYITEQRERKIPDPVIIQTLLQAGYKQLDIDEGFTLLSMTQSTEIPVAPATIPLTNTIPPPSITTLPQQENPKPRFAFHMPPRWVMVGIAAFLTIVLGIGIVLFISSSQPPEEEEIVQEEEDGEEETIDEQTEEITAEPTEAEDLEQTVSLQTPEARDAKRRNDIALLREALEKYFADKKVYPKSLNELYSGYLSDLAIDPGTFQPYDYFLREDPTQYTLCVQMEGKTRQCANKEYDPTTF
ncbi:MAG: hypothetical protein HY431_00990 [Candidatus Levybacteria bacterium]|nr:hypothetical protein [Candidatus Levybacteria bacterium]